LAAVAKAKIVAKGISATSDLVAHKGQGHSVLPELHSRLLPKQVCLPFELEAVGLHRRPIHG
jgi:hypothetical protein